MKKNSEFDKFLNELSDHELAIFIGYRLGSFLSQSKEKIKNEVIKRKLTNESLDDYFHKPLPKNSGEKSYCCPRCGSERLFTETDYESRVASKFSSVEVAIDTFRCRLCGFNPDKEIPKNIFERIKKYFKNNKTERIIKWDSI